MKSRCCSQNKKEHERQGKCQAPSSAIQTGMSRAVGFAYLVDVEVDEDDEVLKWCKKERVCLRGVGVNESSVRVGRGRFAIIA